MADFPMLRAQAPIVLRDGRPTPEFYGYLLGLDRALGTDYAAQFSALAARVAALEEGGTLALRGIGSISVRNGVVQLLADEDNLSGNSYYGANAAGERGFWPVVDALTAGIGLTKAAQVPWNVLGELDDTSQLPASAADGDAYLIDGDYWVWGSGEWSNQGPPPNAATLGLYPGTAEDDALLWDPVAGDYVPAPALRNPLAAPGDLVRADGAAKPERVPVGTDGQVLTVVAGMPAWADAAGGGGGGGGDGANVVELSTDFMSQPATSNNGADFFTSTSSGVVEHQTAPDNPGIIKMRPSGTAVAQVNISSRSAPFVLGGGEIQFEALIWIDYPMGTAGGQILRAGIGDTLTGEPQWGVFIGVDPTTSETTGWYARVSENGVWNIFGRHNQPIVVGRKYKIAFVVSADGSSVEAFIDGESIGTRMIASPEAYAAMHVRAQMWSLTGGTNAATHGNYVDYLRVRKTLSIPR